jgi:hypothetical protein
VQDQKDMRAVWEIKKHMEESLLSLILGINIEIY